MQLLVHVILIEQQYKIITWQLLKHNHNKILNACAQLKQQNDSRKCVFGTVEHHLRSSW